MSGTGLELAFGSALNLSLVQVFQGMMAALLLGILVAVVYRVSVAGRIVSAAMPGSLIVLAMVGAMVMMVIGNNLARAFSLVGALAIVRFRTRLRSPWDITFVFFALAAGIAAGVGAFRVAVLGTVMVSLAVLALYVLPLGNIRRKVHLLRCDVAAYQEIEAELDRILADFLLRKWMVEARSLRFGETLSYRYRVILRDETRAQELLRALADTEGVERVILMEEEEGAAAPE